MNYPRRKTRITYEGISFLSILAFIVVGSILRQINLLVLLSGLMIGPFFFNWRISRKLLERITARRQLPAWVHARQPFQLDWLVENHRPRIASWELRLTDQIRMDSGNSAEKICELLVHQVDPGGTATAGLKCTMQRRGICQLGPAAISSAWPLGLVRTRIDFPQVQRLIVAPPLGRLKPDWYQLTRTSPNANEFANRGRRGTSHEDFYALRNWQRGDSRRLIHWRSSAKRGELMVRQGVDPATRRITVLLDLAEENPDCTDTLVSMATTIACRGTGRPGQWQLALGVFGDQQLGPVVPGPAVMPALLECLATVGVSGQTGILQSVHECRRKQNAGDQLIVISNRSRATAVAEEPAGPTDTGRGGLANCTWIDVSETQSFFELAGGQQPEVAQAPASQPVAAGAGS